MIETTRRLVEAFGPSGYEDPVREIIRREIEGLADEVRIDALGNLIASVRGDGTGKRVMVAAHMDEIGVIVMHVDSKGFLRFSSIGGTDPLFCLGNRVRFGDGTVGVIGLEKKRRNLKALPEFNEMYIDIGAKNPETCLVEVGDVAVFERLFHVQGDRWTAKSMDDRIGCMILVEVLRKLKAKNRRIENSFFFVFSVQEEVGRRGAKTAAYALRPGIGIALDVTPAGDTPESDPLGISLGKGPAIKIKDSGMISDPRLVRFMIEQAERAGLPYQREVLTSGTTDAQSIQLAHAGVITGCLSIPCRYGHTAMETIDAGDVRNAIELLFTLFAGPIAL